MKALLQKLLVFIASCIFLIDLPLLVPAFAGNVTPVSGNSVMLVSSSTVYADGQSAFTITITLKDGSNPPNPIVGDSVYLTSSDSNDNINPTSSSPRTLDGNGQATFTVTSNSSETDTISVTDTTNPITFQFPGTITFAPTPTISPSPTPIGTCNDAVPVAPQITSAEAGDAHSVVLTWNAVAAPVSYYLVSYGTTSGSYIYGNPNVGNVTSYTVGSLSTGKTYYFAVKAVNGCMPSAYSNEMSGAAGVSVSTPTPTISTDASGTDASTTDQTNQDDVTNQTISTTPTPTEGPPITPAPKSESASAGRMIIYTIIGLLLVVSAIVLILVNKSGKKSGKNIPPITPRRPPPPQEMGTSNMFNQPNGIDPQDESPPSNDQTNS